MVSGALDGDFRQDLLFRLNAITLDVPPLRDRTDDIVPLAELFFGRPVWNHTVVERRVL